MDRGAKIVIIGEPEAAARVEKMLQGMLRAVRDGHAPTLADIDIAFCNQNEPEADDDTFAERHTVLRDDIRIRARTRGQKRYLDAIREHEMTLVIGPAGTGKTYLAMAAAVSAMLNRQVKRIILTRPAVEAGESLGFLPGDLEQKVNPYLRPLYDALYSMVDMSRARRLIDEQRIEVAPLAFMRGRTLDQAFVILDEAQNTTSDQMLMFLTRLGMGSRAVVTGDITQVDLPKNVTSGIVDARRVLQNIPGIGIVRLTKSDVVRNPLVQRIVDAYERDGESEDDSPMREAQGNTPK